MRKTDAFILAVGLILSFSSITSAGVYTFSPTPPDLSDLDHYYWYRWGINWTLAEDEFITGASLFFDDIRNTNVQSQNHLYAHLLDTVPAGVTSGWDNHNQSDYFAGQGQLLFDWQDLTGTPVDRTYNFVPEGSLAYLIDYVTNDGNFGFGFDPDCLYKNSGIRLTIRTEQVPVPEPGSLLLLSLGILTLVGATRRRPASK